MDYLQEALNINKSNRQFITTEEFMNWLFSQGAKQADKWYNQIMPVAQLAGYKMMFKEAYTKKRAIHVREEFGLNTNNILGNSVPSFLEYADYMIPSGYTLDEARGIMYFDTQNLEYVNVFPHPVIVTTRYRNVFTGDHSVKIAYYDNGAYGEIITAAYNIANTHEIQKLTKDGIRVTSESAKFLVEFLSSFTSINIVKIPMLKTTSVLGWNGLDFLPYSNNLEFEGGDYVKKTLNAVRCEGDFDEWKKVVRESCKNDYVRAYMATSFASPILLHTGKPIFITHLWGKSGTAKTVALLLALSVWGNPRVIMCQWNATVVAAEQKAILLNNIPMSMNESELLTGAKGTFFNHSTFIYMYCEGESKPRGAAGGGLQIGGTWNSCCLSNGEGSLMNEKSKEGELNRVLEFRTDEMLFGTDEKAREVADMAKANYGYAGKLFTEECLKYDFNKYWELFCTEAEKHGTGKQAGEMASLLLGDMLMQAIIYGVNVDDAYASSCRFLERIGCNMKTDADIDVVAKAELFIYDWIAQNKANFFCKSPEKEPIHTYGEEEKGVGNDRCIYIYIINSVFNDILAKQGFNVEKIRHEFGKRGIFARTEDKSFSVSKRINRIKTRCYVFKVDDANDD